MVWRSNWWRRTFKRLWQTRRRPYRRQPEQPLGLLIESLEDRTLLSAVVFTGRNLTWNGFTTGGNAAQLSVNATGMLILQDTSGENITLTNAPGDWTGNNTPTVMGLLSDVDAISVNGTAPSADSFAITGGVPFTLTGDLNVTNFNTESVATSFGATAGHAVSLTANSTLALSATVTIMADTQGYRAGTGAGTTAAADLTSTSSTFTDSSGSLPPSAFTYRQDASITAADIPDANQFGGGLLPDAYVIRSDGGSITTPNTTIIFSNATALSLNAQTDVTFDWALDIASLTVTAGGNVALATTVITSGNVGLTGGGDLLLNGSSITGGNVGLSAGGAIFGFGASISANQLTAAAATGIDLRGGNTVTTFQATDSTSGAIAFADAVATLTITGITPPVTGNVTVTNAGGDIAVTGAITASASLVLIAGGAVSESGAGAINTAQLTTNSSTGTTLGGANVVGIFDATNSTSGDITLHSTSGPLTIDGISQDGTGNVAVTNTGGDLLVTGAITAAADVTLTASGSITESGAGAVSANQLTTSSGATTTLGGGNTVAIFQGTNTPIGNLTFADSAPLLTLNGIMVGGAAVQVTNTGGNITLAGVINAGSVTLTAGGSIGESGSGAVQAGNQLTTNSATGTNLGGANLLLGTFQATNTTSGDIIFNDTVGPLTIAGITQSGPGNVLVTDSGSITVTGLISASPTGGTVTFTATNGSITESGAGAVTASQLIISSAAGATLGGANMVAIFQANNSASGNVSLTDSIALLTVNGISEGGTGSVAVTNSGGNLSVTAPITASTASGAVTLMASGAITESGPGAVTAFQLTANTAAGTNLGGANAVTNFSATNSASGNINLTDAVAALTIAGITQSGPGNVVVANTGGNLVVGGKITVTGGTLQLSGQGTVTVNAPIDPPSVVVMTASTDIVINNPVTATDRIALFAGQAGPAFAGNVNVTAMGSLTQTIAGRIGVELYTGTMAGSVTLTGVINAQDTVWLTVTNNVTEVMSAMPTITASKLLLLGSGTGTFDLSQANAVGSGGTAGVLAGQLTGNLTFNNNFAITIVTLPKPQGGPNVAGLTSTTGNVTLTLNSGASLLTIGTGAAGENLTAQGAAAIVDLNVGGITENTGASLTAANLRLRGTGTFNLVQTNVVATIAGNFTGALVFNDNSPNPTGLTVGTVPATSGTSGLTSANSNITLCNTGDILLNQPVNAGTSAGAVTVRLKSGGSVTQGTGPGAMGVITADVLGVDAAGSVLIDKFTSTVSTFAARGAVIAVHFAGPFALGTVTAAACFTTTITGIVAPPGNPQDITICQDNGTLTINMALNAGSGTVRLVAFNGGVTQAAGASITAAALGVRATSNAGVVTGGDIALDLANNNVGTFVALNTDVNRWAIRFLNTNPAGTLVGTVTAATPCFIQTPGVVNMNGDVALNSNNGTAGLTIGSGSGEGVTATGGTVDLFTGGATESVGSVITATNLRLQGIGNFFLSRNNTVATVAGNFAGNLLFANATPLTVGTVLGTPGLINTTGNITLNVIGGTGLLSIGTPPAGGEGISAANGTVELYTGGAVEAAGSTVTAPRLLVVSSLGGTYNFNLSQGNSVNTLAASVTGNLLYANSGPLTVGTVFSPSVPGASAAGVTSIAGNVSLAAGSGTGLLTIAAPTGILARVGTIEFFTGGAVETSGVIASVGLLIRSASAGGPYVFNLSGHNLVPNLAGNFAGNLIYVSDLALVVGTLVSPSGAGSVAGLTSANGNITLNVASGNGAVSIGTPPPAAGGEAINAGTGTVELITGALTETAGSTITAANLLLRSALMSGVFSFVLGQNNAVGTLAGSVVGDILFVDSLALTIGTAVSPSGAANVSGLTNGFHNTALIVGNGTLPLTIGTGTPGQGIAAANLDINAGGVSEATDTPINAPNLRLRSAPGGPFPFALTGNNLVSTLAGDFYGPLTFNGPATSGLVIDTVFGTAGLNSHGSAITLTLGGPLTVNQAVNAGATGNINVTATGNVVFNNDAPVTANTALVTTLTPATLTVNYSGLVDTTWTLTGANAGNIANSRFAITVNPQAIAFTGFVNLTGGAGADTFIFNDAATLAGQIDGGPGTVPGKIDTIDWSRYTTPRLVRVLGPAAHGVFGSEPSLGAGFTDIDRLVGPGAGPSTLTGPDHNNTWTITGPNAGTLATDYGGGMTSQVSFAGFPNLKGGVLIDRFVFLNGGQVTGSIDGGGVPALLADSLDWSQVTTDRVVRITGLGGVTGYAGTEASVASFTNIGQVRGSLATMGNTLAGENQDRTWAIGTTLAGDNVNGFYSDPAGQRFFNFMNFQTLVGGTGADTFVVNATPAGKTVTLFGGDGNDTFNVGGTVDSLDQILGPLVIDGGRASSTTALSQAATVGCPPAPGQAANARPPVSQTASWVAGGNVLAVNDTAGARGAAGLTYGLGRGALSRTGTGTLPVSISFVSVESIFLVTSPNSNATQTVNVGDTAVVDSTNPGTLIHAQTGVQVSGTGNNTVNVFNTGDSTALVLVATAGTTAVGIFSTGANSYTSVTTANGTIYQAGSGAASILDINATGGSNRLNVFPLGNSAGTGPNSITRAAVGGGAINVQNADPTSGLSLFALATAQVNVGLFNKQTPYPAHPFATALVSVAGSGVLNFVNALNQPSAINTGIFRFVSGGGTGINLITSADGTAVYLCSTGVSLPQQTFVAASFLLPTQTDASGRPLAKIVLISQLAASFRIQNFSLPPVVANPNFANPYGFGPPSVAVADVNGDGVPDVIVGAGPGFAPLVTVFDGKTAFNTLGVSPTVLAQFFAYDSRFVGGVYVAAGHIEPTSPINAVITGTGRGGPPVVEAFLLGGPSNPNAFPSGGATMIRFFLAYENTLGGVRVASGNFNGVLNANGQPDHDDIVTAPGPGDAPNVRIFSGTYPTQLLRSFFAYDPAFRGGVDVAAGKFHVPQTPRDVFDDLVTAPASAGTTQINVINGQTLALRAVFAAFPGTFNGVGGLTVDTSAGTPRIIVGSALGQPAEVRAFDGFGDVLFLTPTPFFDAFGNPTNNPALANRQGVAVGGKSR